jgi:hypothetical protein
LNSLSIPDEMTLDAQLICVVLNQGSLKFT